jgi:Uma2 family endonuclease
LLIVEVADTSLLTDRNFKVPAFARAGISEVWLINLPTQTIEVYSDPSAGLYRQCQKFARGEVLTSATINGLTLLVDTILG